MTVELLQKYGYQYTGSCRCDGFFTKKYKKGRFEIRWRESRFKFKVKRGGSAFTDWLPLENLEKTLNELDKQDI